MKLQGSLLLASLLLLPGAPARAGDHSPAQEEAPLYGDNHSGGGGCQAAIAGEDPTEGPKADKCTKLQEKRGGHAGFFGADNDF